MTALIPAGRQGSQHPRFRRVARWLVRGLGWFALGLVLLIALLLVSINLTPVGRLVSSQVNSLLEPTFRGQLLVRRLGQVDLDGITGAEVEVRDPQGRPVLAAQGIGVRLFWPAVVSRVVVGSDPLSIPIRRVSVQQIEITLIDDGSGTPTLAHAFEPKDVSPPDPSATKISVSIASLSVLNTRVQGRLDSVGPIDADLHELKGRLTSDAQGLSMALENLELAARQLPRVDRVSGHLSGEVMLPAAPTPATVAPSAAPNGVTTEIHALRPTPLRRVLLAFAGEVAGSATEMQLRWVGEELLGRVQAPALSPSTLTQIVPALSASAPVALDAKLEGQLDDLGLEARLEQARARISAKGRLRGASPKTHASLRVESSNVDLSQLLAEAPRTDIELVADANLDSDERGSHGHYHLVSSGSRLAGEALPKTTLAGELQLPAGRPLHTKGTLEIAEPGAPTRLEYTVTSAPSGSSARVVSNTELDHPPRLRELTGVDARGSISLRAELDPASEHLNADLDVRLRDVRHPQVSAASVTAALSAQGTLQAPRLRLSADARELRAAGRSLARLSLSGHGTPERAVVTARAIGRNPERIELQATLAPRALPQVLNPRVRVHDGTEDLLIAARAVGFAAGRLEVDGFSLDGPGHADVSFSYGPGLERLDLSARALDAARVLRIFGVESPLRSGWLDLQAQLSRRGRGLSGRLVGDIRQVVYAEVEGSLHTDVGIERDQLDGDAVLELTPGGTTQIALRELRIPRGPLRASDLDRMSGEVSLRGELDLSRLQSLLPLAHVESAQGQVRYDVTLEGSEQSGEPPGLRAHVETQGLVLVGERPAAKQTKDAEQARQTTPWSLSGIDLNVDAGLERNAVHVRGKLFDPKGDLLTWIAILDALPAQRTLLIPSGILLRAPLTAEVQVPLRSLEELPASIRPPALEGNLQLALDADGSLLDPRLRVRASVERFAPASDRQRKLRLDVHLDGEYTAAGGRVAVTALRRHAEPVLELDSRWSGDARQLAGATGGKSPVLADFELALNEFPIGAIPQLQQRQVRGRVTGKAQLKDFGKDARLDVDLHTHELALERVVIDELHAVARGAGGNLELQTEIKGQAGEAEARVNGPFTWGDKIVPSSDGQFGGSLQARQLRLSVLSPLVEGSISELDGKLDADLNANIQRGSSQVTGRATLREGVFQMPAVGQRFSDIDADVELAPGSLRVDNVKARGLSGGFQASAEAQLAGLMPTSAEATLRIKENDKLPLTVEGESMGEIWGNVQASYRREEGSQTNRIQVKLDKVHVELPRAPPGGLQGLDPPKDIRVGYWRRDGQFVPVALQPLEEAGPPSAQTTVLVVDLGTVSLKKGQQANVELTGKLEARLGNELDVQGRIDTKRGKLDISGKTFAIERGSVVFNGGKPDEPTIAAVARYDSPASFTVYAEYTGTPKQGKLSLRAEPPLSQDEIVTLLLFGSPDGSLGAGGSVGDPLNTAVSVAGGTAAQGLNRAISDLTDLNVSTRVDTSTGAPRPELVLQFSPRVSGKVSQVLGEPAPGESPDRTFVTIDLRVANSWSLSSTVGDKGASAFDVIWRRRY